MLTAVLLVSAVSSDLTATEIMARVGENQTRAAAIRRNVVYKQSVLSRMHRGDKSLAREHDYSYVVAPKDRSTEKKLESFKGKYERDGQFHEYNDPNFEYKDIDIDGDILDSISSDLTNDEGSRDGISKDLFPLTPIRQMKFDFALAGREQYQDRSVYKILFKPKKEFDKFLMPRGEALIDTKEFEPVLVTTHQTKGVPLAVRALLGTNIRQVGFKLAYRKFGEGLWFPSSYGGEFDVRVLFGYRRKISISLKNSGVQLAHAESTIKYDTPGVPSH